MKAWAVFKREYVQAVRRKSFVIMTLAAPIFLVLMTLGPALLSTRGFGEKRVLVVDGTSRLGDAMAALDTSDREDELASRQGLLAALTLEVVRGDPDALLAASLPRLGGDDDDTTPSRGPSARSRVDGILVLSRTILDTPDDAKALYYARSSTDWFVQRRLERALNRAVLRERWVARGLDPAELDPLERVVPLEAVRVSSAGHVKGGGEIEYVVGFIFVALLFLPVTIYGQSIMLGIVQEKTDRVVEVLLSSMSTRELLTGKVLGLAAVGLTQVGAWIGLGGTLAASASKSAGVDLTAYVRPAIAIAFPVFFILGYLVQVCAYAMGGAIANSEREARQIVLPVALVSSIPWMLVTPILTSPESSTSVVLSLLPFVSPITMFIRILVSEPPAWQIALAALLSLATVALLFHATAKVFRVGLLSYGKRPTWSELWRWIRAE